MHKRGPKLRDHEIVTAGYLRILLNRVENWRRQQWAYIAQLVSSSVGVAAGIKFELLPVSYVFLVIFAYYFFKIFQLREYLAETYYLMPYEDADYRIKRLGEVMNAMSTMRK